MTVLVAIITFYAGAAFGFFVCALLASSRGEPRPKEDI